MKKRQRKKYMQKQWFRDMTRDMAEYLKGNWTQVTVTDENDVYYIRFKDGIQVSAEFVMHLEEHERLTGTIFEKLHSKTQSLDEN